MLPRAFVRPLWSAVLHSLQVWTGVAMAAALLVLGLSMLAGDPAARSAATGVVADAAAAAHGSGAATAGRTGTRLAAERPAADAADAADDTETAVGRTGRVSADDPAARWSVDDDRQAPAPRPVAGLPDPLVSQLSARVSGSALGGDADRSPVGRRAPPLR